MKVLSHALANGSIGEHLKENAFVIIVYMFLHGELTSTSLFVLLLSSCCLSLALVGLFVGWLQYD